MNKFKANSILKNNRSGKHLLLLDGGYETSDRKNIVYRVVPMDKKNKSCTTITENDLEKKYTVQHFTNDEFTSFLKRINYS